MGILLFSFRYVKETPGRPLAGRPIWGKRRWFDLGNPAQFTAKALRRCLYLPPVMAMPSMNCFWNSRYKISMGIIASRLPAISTGKLVVY